MHALNVCSPACEPEATANGVQARANGEPAREMVLVEAPESSSEAPVEVDSALRDGLANSKSRATVLKYEKMVEDLLADEHRQEMRFCLSLTGYQRLLAHRVSQYYGLQTSTLDGDCADKGKIQVVKTGHTRAPKVRLADLKVSETTSCEPATVEAPKLLRKKSGQHTGRHGLTNGDISRANSATIRTPMERMQEYERKKERIFGDGAASAAPPANGGARSGRGAGLGSDSSMERLGFGGGRGRSHASAGGKALLRNRDEERRDPDFQRDHARFQQHFAPGFGEQPGLRQGAYAPARTYSSEFPRMAAGASAAGGAQRSGGAQLGALVPFSNGGHGGSQYAANGQRGGYGGGNGGSGPPSARQNGSLAPMMAVAEGFLSAMPAHAAMGGMPGYTPMPVPYALLPGQGMHNMQGYGVYAPGGMAMGGVPMLPAPGMGYAYLQPQRPGADGHALSPMAHGHAQALGPQALGPQAMGPMAGMALPPGAIPMTFPGYVPGSYGVPLHMMQGMPVAPAPRPRAPARTQPPARRSNPGPGLQRHQRTNSGGSSTSTATSLKPVLSQSVVVTEVTEAPKPAAAAVEAPASAGGTNN
ncbi:hypothetical protein WJX81_002767 [Elliptochloris bilobata]|uniref:R3H domain-containing protein n=1 Tax=Elliptochloris bilobata TaxID=381761 RepID=A0AAW1R2W0_9CHLO